MSTDSIGSLSISALKSILFTNHVTTGQILEKSDLVKKVLVLVEDEKAERVRQRQMEEREEMERLQRAMEGMDGTGHFERDTEDDGERDRQANDSGSGFDTHHSDGESRQNEGGHETNHSPQFSTSAPPSHPKPTGSTFERPGMCVICQDEDANIAIIDCGYVIYFSPYPNVKFPIHSCVIVIWRCVEHVQSWSWRARKSVLYVAHVLSLRLDYFGFLGRRSMRGVGIIYNNNLGNSLVLGHTQNVAVLKFYELQVVDMLYIEG